MARRSEQKQRNAKGYDPDGKPIEDYKPGLLNKSMIAFSTVADGIEQSAKQLLTTGSSAASTVVGHRFGPEAGQVAANLAGGVRNVGLVYVDAAGVSRKAVIKSVAKGMVVGRMPSGHDLVVGGGDGGELPPEAYQQKGEKGGIAKEDYTRAGQMGSGRPGYGEAGYGNTGPPSYASGAGEPSGSSDRKVEDYYGKR